MPNGSAVETGDPKGANLPPFKIDLWDEDISIEQKPRYLGTLKREVVHEEIKKLTELGIIERRLSRFASPVVLVKKSNSVRYR